MRQDIVIVAAAATCCVFVLVTEPGLITLLRRAAVMDSPNGRSSHQVPTPRGGGLPIAVALTLFSLLAFGTRAVPFALAVGGFGALGLADDLRTLKARTRLLCQAAIGGLAASLLIWHAFTQGALGGAAGIDLPWLITAVIVAVAALPSVVWIAGVVNAFNFMDGINGISAGHAMVGGVAYALFGVLEHDSFIAASGAAISATGLAFMPWNAFHAQVFLGDVGSYALGGGLAILAIESVLHGATLEAATAPLALYLADTFWTLQRRIRTGEAWLEAHRTHAYQRLCDAGWSHQKVAAAASGLTVVLCVLGAASLTGNPGLRIGGDLMEAAVLTLYLSAPSLASRAFRQARTA